MIEKKISSFKKFSDIKNLKSDEGNDIPVNPFDDDDIPMNPNIPKKTNKVERMPSRKNIIPNDQNIDIDNNMNERKIHTYGKVAKFPKKTKAHRAFNFLENVKISKKSIWYIMVESQDNELQMIKYNYNEGVDLVKFVQELKRYYIDNNTDSGRLVEAINNITIEGNDKYSKIMNIPKITVGGKPLIAILTEDLIKLLSK